MLKRSTCGQTFMETNVPRSNELLKTELEFYLRLFEKAERDLKKKGQSAPDLSTSERMRARPRTAPSTYPCLIDVPRALAVGPFCDNRGMVPGAPGKGRVPI
jgi:hypothetical protein